MIIINQPRVLKVLGLGDVSVTSPVADWQKMQNNKDGTVTVIIDFYKDQATAESGGEPFDTRSYQIDAHVNVDTYLKSELRKQGEFAVIV